MTQQPAALGFRVHSGWGVAVLVAGSADEPKLVLRQRVDLAPAGYAVQMYHVAAALDLADATRLVDGARVAAVSAATRAVGDLAALAAAHGLSLAYAGLAADPRPTLHDLASILALHPRMHRAEADLYRDALVDAAALRAVPLTLTAPGRLRTLAAEALGCGVAEVDRLLVQFGRSAGPPWQQDHKLAAMAGLVALLER
jgi:hypothetical protein